MPDERTGTRWDDDPVWTTARARTREEVRAAFAPRTRRCQSCGHEAADPGRNCPACGEPYVALRDPGMSKRAKRRLFSGLALAALVLAAAAALIAPQLQSSTRDFRAEQQRQRARDIAQARRQAAVDQRLHTASASRPVTVAAVQRAVNRDARARAASGALSGPILRTECSPYGPNPFSGASANYVCTAVSGDIPRHRKAGGVIGYPFWAKADSHSGRIYWCKVNPKPGEMATSSDRDVVPLDSRCDVTR